MSGDRGTSDALFLSSNCTWYVPTPDSVNMLVVMDVITKLLFAVNTGLVIGRVNSVEELLLSVCEPLVV